MSEETTYIERQGTVLCLGKDGGTVIMFLGNTYLIF